VRKRVNRLPLGAAALAGTSYPLDRERGARTLGMDGVCQNSLDAVSDRDFAIEFTAAASAGDGAHQPLLRGTDPVDEPELRLHPDRDRFTTGSSIMPQKKNPDVPELARGKTGRVVGHLMALITLMKGQPLAYNKDNQEDKEPLFDTVDTLKDTLRIFAEMIGGITVKPQAMDSRRAARLRHRHRPGRLPGEEGPALPRRARNRGARREGRGVAQLRPVRAAAGGAAAVQPGDREGRVRRAVLRGSLNARNTLGGTAPAQVKAQVARHRARLG
jgi:argininosuccinate lyase